MLVKTGCPWWILTQSVQLVGYDAVVDDGVEESGSSGEGMAAIT
jgi:hypothetical protein